jgi:hypothetical protein
MCDVYEHYWVYGGIVAHYEKCPTCGQERLIRKMLQKDLYVNAEEGIPLLQEEPTIETNEFNGIDEWGNPLIYWVG